MRPYPLGALANVVFIVVGVLVFLGLVDRITADMAVARGCAFAGFACGAMFGLAAMLMLLQGVMAFMQCSQRGPICRAQRLLIHYYDQHETDPNDNKAAVH